MLAPAPCNLFHPVIPVHFWLLLHLPCSLTLDLWAAPEMWPTLSFMIWSLPTTCLLLSSQPASRSPLGLVHFLPEYCACLVCCSLCFMPSIRASLSVSPLISVPLLHLLLFNHQVLPTLTPWTVAHQVPLTMGFPRQEYWSGLLFPFPGNFLTQGSNPGLPHSRQTLYHLSYQGSLTPKSSSLAQTGFPVSRLGVVHRYQLAGIS